MKQQHGERKKTCRTKKKKTFNGKLFDETLQRIREQEKRYRGRDGGREGMRKGEERRGVCRQKRMEDGMGIRMREEERRRIRKRR